MTEGQQSISLNLDVFQKNCREALMFSVFESMEAGVSMIISNSQTLDGLKKKFEAAELKNATISVLENGPTAWIMSIKKNEEKQAESCCGVCGGR